MRPNREGPPPIPGSKVGTIVIIAVAIVLLVVLALWLPLPFTP